MFRFLFLFLFFSTSVSFAADPDPSERAATRGGSAPAARAAQPGERLTLSLCFHYLEKGDYINSVSALSLLAKNGSFPAAATLFVLSNKYKGKALPKHRTSKVRIEDPKLSQLLDLTFKGNKFKKKWCQDIPLAECLKSLYPPAMHKKADIVSQLFLSASNPQTLLESQVFSVLPSLKLTSQRRAALTALTNYGIECDFQRPEVIALCQHVSQNTELEHVRFYSAYMAFFHADLSSTLKNPRLTESQQIALVAATFSFCQERAIRGVLSFLQEESSPLYIPCVEAAADVKSIYGHFAYADALYKGQGVPQSIGKALLHYKAAADLGLVEGAHTYASVLLLTQRPTLEVLSTVRAYRQQAADKGFFLSLMDYGSMLYNGQGGPKDKELALQYMKRALDQKPKDLEALYRYGFVLHDAARRDSSKVDSLFLAARCLKQAVDGGHKAARGSYAEFLMGQERFGEAFEYDRQSAADGDGISLLRCGALLANGQVTLTGSSLEETRQAALDYFQSALRSGKKQKKYSQVIVSANYYIGRVLIETGRLVDALPYLKKAAENGHANATTLLLTCYETPEETTEVDEATQELYQTATYLFPPKPSSHDTAAAAEVESTDATASSAAAPESTRRKPKIKTRPPTAQSTVYVKDQEEVVHEALVRLENRTEDIQDTKAKHFITSFFQGSVEAAALDEASLLHTLATIGCAVKETKSGFLVTGLSHIEGLPNPTFSWHREHGAPKNFAKGYIRRVLKNFLHGMGYFSL